MGKHDIGGTAFNMADGVSRRVIAVTCSKCQEVTAGSDKPNAPLDVVIRHFATRGFLITERGRKAVCPKCQESRPDRRTVDESEVMDRLDRQREAEERRTVEHKQTVSQPAEPATTPQPMTFEATLDEATRHLAEVRMHPARPSVRDWRSAPRATAEVVRLFLACDDRARMFNALSVACPAIRTSLIYFSAGLVSDGSRPWGDLRAHLTEMGVRWEERQKRSRNQHLTDDKPTATKEEAQTMTAPNVITATPAPAVEPTREARRAAARMYALLDQHFSVVDGSDHGAYADGWSDERVAAESGLSVAEVARTREDVYGRLAEDPRVAELSAKVDALQIRAERDLADLAKMSASIREQVDADVADLRRQLDALRKPRVVG
jgi:hypothetical protein